MIKNAREYQITKAQAAKFQRALSAPAPTHLDIALVDLERAALREQLKDLEGELTEYDALESGSRKTVEVDDLGELPRALIQARIAAGLSQREFAKRLGLKEQQIQRYEATDYATASLTRLREVVRALDVKLRQDIVLPTADVSVRTLIRNLDKIGFDQQFVRDRLILDEEPSDGNTTAWRTTNAVGRVLGVPITEVVRGDFTRFERAPLQGSFKLPAGVNLVSLRAYAAYARYLAQQLVASVEPTQPVPLEDRPRDVFDILSHSYGGVTFSAALRFVWDRGLLVLPLRDVGVFHGAFWRIRGRGVLVLKQRTASADRWLIDLLHEYYHAIRTQGLSDAEFLETQESPFDRRESDEERTATAWAIASALNEREDELAQACIDQAGGQIPYLKRVVPETARRAGVPIGVLADYLAHRLHKHQQADWWGTAVGLESRSGNPWETARDALFAKIDLHRLGRIDRELLTRALIPSGDIQ